jgi:4-amino-4-deoxy-L-arabinose transferase-like glycosyltransferase
MAGLRRQLLLALIVAGYAVLAVLYATRVPIWNAPDEPAHYNNIYAIAILHQLPVLRPGDYDQALLARLTHDRFPPGESVATLRYESHQPPLYYLLAAPILVVLKGAAIRTQVVALRLFTALIGALFILSTYRLARLLFPKSDVAGLAAAAFVAFIPQHLFMSAAIDNDALAELMLALALIVAIEDVAERGKSRRDVRAGVVVGLAVLTKLVAAVSAVVVVAGILGAAFLSPDRRASFRQAPFRIARIAAVSLVLSGWWFVRNAVIYGIADPVGLRRHAEVVAGQPLTGHLSPAVARQMGLTLFHSFWGQFGWMGIPYADRTYDVLASFSALIFLGILLFTGRALQTRPVGGFFLGTELVTPSGIPTVLSPAQMIALGILALEILLVALGVIFYNLRYLQPQGRYLFPTLPALAVFVVGGVAELFNARYVGVVLALAALALYWLCLFSLFSVIGPAFAAS